MFVDLIAEAFVISFWGMDTQTTFSPLSIPYPNMAVLEILRWLLSVILDFQVHFLQSMLLLDCWLCYFTGCYSTP